MFDPVFIALEPKLNLKVMHNEPKLNTWNFKLNLFIQPNQNRK